MKIVEAPDIAAAELLTELVAGYATRHPVRRVTVVGNAPLTPSAERQRLIDSADLVVRCNSFVLDRPGQVPCLGTKTDVVVIARATRITPYVFQQYRSRAYLVPDVGNLRIKKAPSIPASWPTDLGCMPIPNSTLGLPLKRLLAPESGGYGVVPTTGTLAAYLAYRLFPDAICSLTGFSFLDQPGQTTWAHHYGTRVPVHRTHLIDREAKLLQAWVDERRVVWVP